MRTRSQLYSELVYKQILPLKEVMDNEHDHNRMEDLKKEAKQYGSLCHNFPIMVLRSGLSQTVAFVWVKSKGKTDTPYGKFLKHLSELTGEMNEAPKDFQQRINTAELMDYQRWTRITLTASIWYKRFAESILDVKAGEDAQDDVVEEDENA